MTCKRRMFARAKGSISIMMWVVCVLVWPDNAWAFKEKIEAVIDQVNPVAIAIAGGMLVWSGVANFSSLAQGDPQAKKSVMLWVFAAAGVAITPQFVKWVMTLA